MLARHPPAESPPKRLLLAGAGHAHAQVLLDFARRPVPGTTLTVVSPEPLAPYSGMVPGWLAGRYRFEEIVVDFEALCRAAGARWVRGELDALDPGRRTLRLASGERLDWDLLSLNVGSTLRPPQVPDTPVLSLRPLSALRPQWEALLRRWCEDPSDSPATVAAVGAGAAGFESLLAALARLRALRPGRPVTGRLLTRGDLLLPGIAPAARRAAERALARAGVMLELRTEGSAQALHGSAVVLWATGAQAQAWQADPARRGGLAVDEAGFIRIDEQLRSVSHPQVFAVGDCARWTRPLPKAGVYAVRMGPVLSRNLRAALGQGDWARYRPQSQALALLATGDGGAIASHGWLGASGRWAWGWKDRIDRGFVNRFRAEWMGTSP